MADQQPPGDGNEHADSLNEARELFEDGRYDRALRICRRVIDHDPENAAAHALVGDVYTARRQWADAIVAYEASLDVDFDPQIMQRLAAARANAGAEPETEAAARPRTTARPETERAPGETIRPYLIGAMIVLLLLIPLLALVLVKGSEVPTDTGAIAGDTTAPRAPGTEAAQVGSTEPQGTRPPGHSWPQAAASGAGGAAKSMAAAEPRGGALTRPEAGDWSQPSAGSGATPAGGEGQPKAPYAPVSTRDRNILRNIDLRRVSSEKVDLRATAMALDDYTGLGVLTISARPTRDLSALERSTLRGAYHAAANAMRADEGLTTLVVRCLVRFGRKSGEPEQRVIFRASVKRSGIEPWLGRDTEPSVDQIKGQILKAIWWDSQALGAYAKSAD